MFYCIDESGNKLCCPYENEIYKCSQRLWNTTSINNELWVNKVYEFFDKMDTEMKHINTVYALCHLPTFVYFPNDVKVVINSLKCHYILNCHDVFNFNCTEETAYHEDIVLSLYIHKFYNDRNGLIQLSQHISKLYQFCIPLGKVPIAIRYLYEKTVKFKRIPDFISLITFQPIHMDVQLMIFNFSKIMCSICKSSKSHMIVYAITRPLVVASEKEWNLICHFRNTLKFVRKNKKQTVQINFGRKHWESEWHVTQIHYENQTYYEKWDDRIKWISIIFHKIYIGEIDLSLCPKDLILALTKLLV